MAVIFGHAAALNWGDKKNFADVGLALTNAFWKEGYYADLIPASEVSNGSLKLNRNGSVQYGPQHYKAVVLFNPEFGGKDLAQFFVNAAQGSTDLFRVGNCTKDFDGQSFDGNAALPERMQAYAETGQAVQAVITSLKGRGIPVQANGAMRANSGFPGSVMPGTSGTVRLIDGTVIQASGETNVMGDPIRSTITVVDQKVQFDAVGIAAVRLDKSGQVEALAAGGLQSVETGSFKIELKERADIVLIRENGKWRGIILSIFK